MEKNKTHDTQPRAGGISGMHKISSPSLPLKRKELSYEKIPQEYGRKRMETVVVNDHATMTVRLPAPVNYIEAWCTILPNRERLIQFSDESYILMPYKKIIYGKKNNQVTLQKRKGYTPKKRSDYTVKFLNAGSNVFIECFPIHENLTVQCPLGIPVFVTVDAYNRWSEFSECIIMEPHVAEVIDLSNPPLTKLEIQPVIKKTKRPQKILDRILKERKESALRSYGLSK